MHIGINAQEKNVRVIEITDEGVYDSKAVRSLLGVDGMERDIKEAIKA